MNVAQHALNSYDGINAFNPIERTKAQTIFPNTVDGDMVAEQAMKHESYITARDGHVLVRSTEGTSHGGPKATDVFNCYFQSCMRKIGMVAVREASQLLGGKPREKR